MLIGLVQTGQLAQLAHKQEPAQIEIIAIQQWESHSQISHAYLLAPRNGIALHGCLKNALKKEIRQEPVLTKEIAIKTRENQMKHSLVNIKQATGH